MSESHSDYDVLPEFTLVAADEWIHVGQPSQPVTVFLASKFKFKFLSQKKITPFPHQKRAIFGRGELWLKPFDSQTI